MSGMVLKDVQNLDFGRGYMSWYYRTVKRDGGMGDGDMLIANAFQILFLNYFADSYIFDAMESIKRDKSLYKFEIKKSITRVEGFIREYDKKVATTMGEDYNEKFANMNFALQDAFQKMLDDLEKVSLKACTDKGVKNAELVAKVQVCVMLLEFSIVNLREKVTKSSDVNPVLSRIRWTAHDEMYHWIRNIDRALKSPDISKDLSVRSVYFRLQKAWNDADFLGDNLGDGLLEETEYEAIELSDLMKSQKKAM